jgi:integrase
MRPFVRLAAKDNKKRKDRDQPIRRDLAAKLHAWLATKPDAGPVWQAAPHADLSLRFRRDLEAARKAWVGAGPTPAERKRREKHPTFLRYVYHDGVRNVFADFHGLRHTGISLVVRGAGLRIGQAWADHSTPVLTARYAHLDLLDEDKALDALPEVAATQRPAKKRNLRIG